MSVKAVNANITRAIADRQLSAVEARQIVSREDGMFSAPVSVGTRTDAKEHAAIADLYGKIQAGEIDAGFEAREALKNFLAEAPESRLSHALKGGAVGDTLASALGGTGAVAGGMVGAAMGASATKGVALGIAALNGAVFGAMGLAAGYGIGVAQGLLDD